MNPLLLSLSKPVFFSGFLLLVIIGLAADLGAFTRNRPHVIGFREALWRTIGWVAIGLLFSLIVYFYYADAAGLSSNFDFAIYRNVYGGDFTISDKPEVTRHVFSVEMMVKYLSGYFVEYSLSIDNLFVMMLIFSSFNVNEKHRKNILFWGVFGAICMRFIFIFLGSALIREFDWIIKIFGVILLYSGFKLLIKNDNKENSIDTENHRVVKLARKILPLSSSDHDGRFWKRENGRFVFTSLMVVLLVIEVTDVLFAVDSVPAIFGITRDPYVVFCSNIFAILGLRSLYFLISHSLSKLSALKYGLSLILIFIGGKMIFEKWFDLIGFNHFHNLMLICAIIVGTMMFSWIWPAQNSNEE